MECKKEKTALTCGCTYNCSKKGMCCECVAYHRDEGELPGCFFPPEFEKTYDRSRENFFRAWKIKK